MTRWRAPTSLGGSGSPYRGSQIVSTGISGNSGTLRPLTLALTALAAGSFASLTLLSLAPEIQRSLRLSTFEIGAIGSVIYLSATPSAWAAGIATTRLGLAAVVSVSLSLLAAGLAICALSAHGASFFLGVAVLGAGYGAVNPPTNVLADTPARERRALTVSIKQAGVPLGGVVAGVTASLAIRSGSWRSVLVLALATCVAVGVVEGVVLRRVPLAAGTAGAGDGHHPGRTALDSAGFLFGAVQTATLAYLTTYAVAARGFSPAAAAAAFATALAASVLARPAWGFIADRTGDRSRVLLAVCALAVAGLAALILLPGATVWISLPAVGAACAGWNGVYLTLVMETVPPAQVARRTGRAQVFINAGAVCGPLLFGVTVSHARSWPGAWMLVALLAIVAGWLIRAARRTLPVRDATAATWRARRGSQAEENDPTGEKA